ncbi:MAG: hypothetical protein GF331_24770, partial [Chitinivibrionales bacterium]|nr:hypothetical protein [Chitinivibrionales bacterium]
MRQCIVAFLIAGIAVLKPCAQTPQERVQRFSELLGPNTYARLAWRQGGPISEWYESYTRTVWVMDTKDGQVRELTPVNLLPGSQPNVDNPSITADGSRVIFQLEGRGTYVINWDGTGLRQVRHNDHCRYWHGPGDTDWSVGYDPAIGGAVRVNIDEPSSVVTLWNDGEITPTWISLSTDGTVLAADFPWPEVGIASVPNGQVHYLNPGDWGCWPDMAPDNTHDVLWQLDPHTRIAIADGQGNRLATIGTTEPIWDWADQHGKYNDCSPDEIESDATRWSNRREYITFWVKNVVAGPFVMRLSDRAWAAVYDDVGCEYRGNMAMWVYTDEVQGTAPRIAPMDAVTCMAGEQSSITVDASGTPAPTLSAQGLPAGMALIDGTSPATSFVIRGTPTQVGEYTVTLHATNALGSDNLSFTIEVTVQNTPPTVSAGADSTAFTGIAVQLQGEASDDGVPAPLVVRWRQIGGPAGGATFADTTLATSAVTFSQAGSYRLTLSATDGEHTRVDTVVYTVTQSIPFTVLSPSAGQRVPIGGECVIEWQVQLLEGMRISLSTNGGETFTQITAGGAVGADTTVYVWHVAPSTPPSDDCIIRVSKYLDPGQSALSATFSLVNNQNAAMPARTAGTAGWRPVVLVAGRAVSPFRQSLPPGGTLSLIDTRGRIIWRRSSVSEPVPIAPASLPPGA